MQFSDIVAVGGDRMEKVGGAAHVTVGGDRSEQVSGTESLTVGAGLQQKVGTNHALEAGQEIHLKSGMKVIIEAGMQLTIKASGGFVDIGPAGVTIQGTMVLINSGGSAGSGVRALGLSDHSGAALAAGCIYIDCYVASAL